MTFVLERDFHLGAIKLDLAVANNHVLVHDFRYPQLGWREDRPNLERLAAKLADRPSFADTVPAD